MNSANAVFARQQVAQPSRDQAQSSTKCLSPVPIAIVAGKDHSADHSSVWTGEGCAKAEARLPDRRGLPGDAVAIGEIKHAVSHESLCTKALFERCYTRLLTVARRELRRWPKIENADAAALISSVYLRLADSRKWECEAAFMAAATNAMREVLVDETRRRQAAKRGGNATVLPLDSVSEPRMNGPEVDLLDLNAALSDLLRHDARLASVVIYRYFGGYSNMEAAEHLGVTVKTVQRDWTKAKAWLFQMMRFSEATA